MSFKKKVWKNRVAEYINRRLLTFEDGNTKLVTVARDEGTISQEGDPFSAETMNDLENRVEEGFEELKNPVFVKTKNTDLDDYKTTGLYFFTSDYTPANIPVGVNGWLRVLIGSSSNVKQFWIRQGTVNKNDHNMFVRSYDGSAWGNWNTIAMKADIDALKKSVSDGKSTVAGAITEQGVDTAADATFGTMASNIGAAGANKYNTGRSQGISEADARVNTNSASYKSGYSNGFTAGKQQSDGDCHTYCEANQNDLIQNIYKQPGKSRVTIRVISTGNSSNWQALQIWRNGTGGEQILVDNINGDYDRTYAYDWGSTTYMTVKADHITTSTSYAKIESTQS